jgi:hypothetical protein
MHRAICGQRLKDIPAMRDAASTVRFDASPGVPVEREREWAQPNIKRVGASEFDADQARSPVDAKLKMHGFGIREFPRRA